MFEEKAVVEKGKHRISYWPNFAREKEKLSEILKKQLNTTIEKLGNGELKSASLEQKNFRHSKLYTAKINKSDRLLLKKVKINGEPHFLLLEVILNHDYQKSRFIKESVLREFLEKKGLAKRNVGKEDFIAPNNSNLLFSKDSQEKVNKSKLQEGKSASKQWQQYKNRIILSDMQRTALEGRLPMMINGAPGSGKSLLALELIKKETHEEGRMFYITRSELLKQEMKKTWRGLPISKETKEKASFLTYDEYCLLLNPNLKKYYTSYACKAHFR